MPKPQTETKKEEEKKEEGRIRRTRRKKKKKEEEGGGEGEGEDFIIVEQEYLLVEEAQLGAQGLHKGGSPYPGFLMAASSWTGSTLPDTHF